MGRCYLKVACKHVLQAKCFVLNIQCERIYAGTSPLDMCIAYDLFFHYSLKQVRDAQYCVTGEMDDGLIKTLLLLP